ncbi:MAG: TlyA family RNA methyltransferase [Acidimicrobiia bacterium]|nr:TlyA family RNA methyltransferase [Acidimicrobiia bacterium]
MGSSRRRRLDSELVRRELASSRAEACRLIEERVVTVNGTVAERAARAVLPGDALEVLRRPRFVSRGGKKLEGALAVLGLEVTGKRCIDVGASVGGFSDCLLQRGAAQVVAVDVGRAQLHERLQSDARVRNLEGVNVRHLQPGDAGGPAELVTVDLSFIGLRLVMERLAALTATGGDLLALVKPQFEAGRREASAGRGVIRSPEVWRRTLAEVAQYAMTEGLAPRGVVLADPPGAEGNTEFFLHCRKQAQGRGAPPGESEVVLPAVFAVELETALMAAAERAAHGAS